MKDETEDSDYYEPRDRIDDVESRVDGLESKVDDLENGLHRSGDGGCMGCLVFILLIAVIILYLR
ncbi:MAG: hypothetical protein PHO67_07060 [Candidatus Omnitrophica bacterium]|nr:hypothetical protein [Candidatus Omnitrophota bacterium]